MGQFLTGVFVALSIICIPLGIIYLPELLPDMCWGSFWSGFGAAAAVASVVMSKALHILFGYIAGHGL